MIEDGKCKILQRKTVFYSPHQCFSRDVTIEIMRTFCGSNFNNMVMNHLDLFCGCGARSIRFLTEICPLAKAVAVDYDHSAIALALENTKLNEISGPNVRFICEDINTMNFGSLGVDKFHVIEIDPYGSSLPYVSKCIPHLVEGGLLNLTFTNIKDVVRASGDHSLPMPPSIVAPQEFSVRSILNAVIKIIVSGDSRAVPIACWALPHGCRLMIQVFSMPITIPRENQLCPVYCDSDRVVAVVMSPPDVLTQMSIMDCCNLPATCSSRKRKVNSMNPLIPHQSFPSIWGGHTINREVVAQALQSCESRMCDIQERYMQHVAVMSLLRSLLEQDSVVGASQTSRFVSSSSEYTTLSSNHTSHIHWCVVDTRKLWDTIVYSAVLNAHNSTGHGKIQIPSISKICTELNRCGDGNTTAALVPLSHGAIMVVSVTSDTPKLTWSCNIYQTTASILEIATCMERLCAGDATSRGVTTDSLSMQSYYHEPSQDSDRRSGWTATMCHCTYPGLSDSQIAYGDEGIGESYMVACSGEGLDKGDVLSSYRVLGDIAHRLKTNVFFRNLSKTMTSSVKLLSSENLMSLLRPLISDSHAEVIATSTHELRVEILLVLPLSHIYSDDCHAVDVNTVKTDRLKVRVFRSLDECLAYLEKKQHRTRQRHHSRRCVDRDSDRMDDSVIFDESISASGKGNSGVTIDGERREGGEIEKCNRRARRALIAAASASASAASTTESTKETNTSRSPSNNPVHHNASTETTEKGRGPVTIHYLILFAGPPTTQTNSFEVSRSHRLYMGSASQSFCSVHMIGSLVPQHLASSICAWGRTSHGDACWIGENKALTPVQIIIRNSSIDFFSFDTAASTTTMVGDAVCGLVYLHGLHLLNAPYTSTKIQHMIGIKGANSRMVVINCQVSDENCCCMPQYGPIVNAFSVLSSAHITLQYTDILTETHRLRSSVYIDSKASCKLLACRVNGVAMSGVTCCSGGHVAIQHSAISGCMKSGVYAHRAATVRIVCSNICGNMGSGVECISCLEAMSFDLPEENMILPKDLNIPPCNIIILNSIIRDNDKSGYLSLNTCGVAVQTTFGGNRLGNVSIIDDSYFFVDTCRIVGSGKSGVYCRGKYSRFECKSSYIYENQDHQVECADGATFIISCS